MKKILILTTIVLGFFALLSQVAKIYVTNTHALESVEATRLKSDIAKVSDKNMELEAQVLSFSSYSSVASRAAELGYAENRDIVSVYDPQPVTLAR